MTEQDSQGPADNRAEDTVVDGTEGHAENHTEKSSDHSLMAGLANQPLVQEDLAAKYHAEPGDSDDAADPELTNDFEESGVGDPHPDEPEMSAEPEQAPKPAPEPDQVGDAQAEMIAEPSQSADPEPESEDAEGEDEEDAEGEDDTDDTDDEEERRRRDEEFAKEHDPENHDVEAGSEFRQRGDWTADESGAEALESRLEDVRDGGYGVGSAAPFEDGLMPFGHSIKAWHDTMTFVRPGEAGYDGVNPDVWFLDEGFAERVGFRAAH